LPSGNRMIFFLVWSFWICHSEGKTGSKKNVGEDAGNESAKS
jgi:hypothetical protein